MGFGVSIALVAAGAILAFTVNTNLQGVNVHTIGWILLVVGLAGFALSMIFWSSWAGPGYFTRYRTTYMDDDPGAPPPPRH